ncbi:MAG TPA: enoyl-CoA hydratase [Dehalococcoidia bacterium]|nr:enoyl-CoA hydratase [Chloroflexota bacterium]HAA94239.1 enoyl-CoA hydratase [Dehalococcoidia bacterium]
MPILHKSQQVSKQQDSETLNDHIIVETKAPVTTVTFNRPSQRNAISFDMWRQFSEIMKKLDADRSVRAVVVTGAGDEAFSAGADIQDFDEHRSDSTKGRGYNDVVNGALQTLSEMATPTISMIRGFAVGGGCELAVATDLRIASDDSLMGIPVGKLGISIGHREMRGLVNLVGKGNAMYILLSARLLDAEESLRIGLVNQVVPAADLHDHTYKLAGDIASLAPLSHAVNKLTMIQVQNKPSLEGLTKEEADLPLTQFDTKDYLEGYKAFLEKRRPNFIGE